jgi:signal transduction histidine kinase
LVRAELAPFEHRVRLEYVNARSLPELLTRVKAAPERSLIYYLSYWHEEPGKIILPPEIAAMVAAASPVPVYGILEIQMGSGIVGGVVRRTSDGGRQMAELAIRILDGTRAQDVPLVEAALVPMFDWRQLQRWRIDTSRLPANSEILFRTPTAWDLYRWYILGAGGVIVLQAMSIVGLILQKRRRTQAENRARSTTSELLSSNQRIRRLAQELITAQEAERSRLARELHDDIGQRIASLSVGLSLIKRRIQNVDPGVRADAARLQQEIIDLANSLRQLSHEWHSSTLEHVDLIAAVKARAEEVHAESGVAIRVDVGGSWAPPPDDVAMCLYRVAQESLRNIARHSRARGATITFDRLGNAVILRIADDGVGFNPGQNGHHGLGLASMRERVQMLGGHFDIRSQPAAGTVAEAVVPTGERA